MKKENIHDNSAIVLGVVAGIGTIALVTLLLLSASEGKPAAVANKNKKDDPSADAPKNKKDDPSGGVKLVKPTPAVTKTYFMKFKNPIKGSRTTNLYVVGEKIKHDGKDLGTIPKNVKIGDLSTVYGRNKLKSFIATAKGQLHKRDNLLLKIVSLTGNERSGDVYNFQVICTRSGTHCDTLE